jgi:hypothetical protein
MHLVMLFGPPAVGKMTVGRELARLTPYKLFHNHATIDPLLDVFEWGTAPFQKLKMEFRRRVLEEAIDFGVPGLIFTYVWALEVEQDAKYVAELISPVLAAGGRVDFVELWSDVDTRLGREGTAERLAAKPSKRDLEWARADLLHWQDHHVMSTGVEQPLPLTGHPHTVVDNSALSPTEAAEEIARRLSLPRR